MEEYAQFFNLQAPDQEKEWHGNKVKVSEEKKLELRLGPPGEFLSYSTINGGKRVLDDQGSYEGKPDEGKCWFSNTHDRQCKKLSSVPWSVLLSGNSLLYSSSTFQTEKKKEMQPHQKGCSPSSPCIEGFGSVVELDNNTASFPAATRDGTSGPLKSRVAPAAVVGWPPIRSSRKNLASSGSNSKQASDLPNKTPVQGCAVKPESSRNDLFVKINMEGVPIGRKINLNAYDSYEKLSIAIDELFRGLLAAQREISAASNASKNDEAKAIASGVGIGEYTLVYEDSEGDRILVGDVPWHMFVSTAKRLRVLKSSELTTSRLSDGSREQDKLRQDTT